MADEKSGSLKGVPLTFIGGILLLAMLIISTVSILGAVSLYTSFPLNPYPIHLLGIKLLPTIWVPVPNYGYRVFTEFISDLGVGPSSFIFNGGIIIAGAITVLMFPTLLKPLGSTGTAKIGVVIGIIAGVGLAGVGAFPENTGFYHVLFATMFFVSIFTAAGVLSYANNSTSFFSKTVQRLGYFAFLGGLICTGLVLIFGPPPEWGLLLLLLIWALPLSIEMLAKGK
ncbi:MAG: DUF998 domain-containing protein [Candidatus Jordarchaeum sp.]|uniref:DUF998 domain-containing protein n=1 Tax=Candidatus Jordarchaeum sp. TaxID=2823881 RepID=UPI00404A00A2